VVCIFRIRAQVEVRFLLLALIWSRLWSSNESSSTAEASKQASKQATKRLDCLTYLFLLYSIPSHSLDTLERQEQALKARLRAAVLPELACDPIGVAGAADDRHKQSVTSQLHHDNTKVDPTDKPATVSFWDKYRPRYEELLRTQPQDDDDDDDDEDDGDYDDDVDESMDDDEQLLPHLRKIASTPPLTKPSSSRFRLSLESSTPGSAMSLSMGEDD